MAYQSYYAKNTQGIKKGDLVFRDRRTKTDSGYFFVEEVEEHVRPHSNPPNQTEIRICARKVAYRDGKQCRGRIREFAVETCQKVDALFIDQAFKAEMETAAKKRDKLMNILEELRELNV